MHRLSFFSLLFICIAVLADGKAPDGFVLIPKNPAFSFARQHSPIMGKEREG